ncbi:MAG: transglycosylase domain-containing protein [Anaeromyxobacter sp.]|nr:transglycosylase domain-containing protein [Anaeromyxobacter sp.]MBL0278670.1 transglycosylase domain-containing protein [Anaeromyxobacter sp.]
MTAARLALALLGAALLSASAFVLAPLPAGLLERRPVAAVRFTDREGGLLREVASRADGRAVPLPPDEPVPPLVQAAFVASEDARFGRHPGVDPLALARAAWQDLRARRVVSGGSTLAMQLARALVPRPRTLLGKVQEALWALRLQAHLDDQAVLRAYLDRVPLGPDLFGVESAAGRYFARPARTLSAGQAALLAALARAPSRLDPWRRPEALAAPRRAVLARMARLGHLTAEEARLAGAAPLDLTPPTRAFAAPHLVEALVGSLGALGLERATRVETTLDPSLQADVEAILAGELQADERLPNAAALVVDNQSGEVLAYAGSAAFHDGAAGGQNDGVRARRQPGSALKPFAYGLGLARGFTPATLLPDVEVAFGTPVGAWMPRNYDRREHGPVRLRAALQNSYNVPAVHLVEALGVDQLLQTLRAAGFTSLEGDAARYGAGLVLGNGDVTLRELARGYRGLARGGLLEPLREVRAAWDAAGRPLAPAAELAPRRFLPAPAVALLTDVLSDEAARAPAFGLDNALRLPFRVAAKTGTSRASVDNWTVGYTAERTVAVWVGSFDGRPMRQVSGIAGAGPIFARVLARAMRGLPAAPLVDRRAFQPARVCPLSGRLAGPACPGGLEEVFLPGSAPTAPCDMHLLAGGRGRERPVLDLGPRYRAWAKAEGLQTEEVVDAGPERLAILLPADGDEYLVEAGLPDGAQAIPVRLLVPRGTARVTLRAGAEVLELAPPFTGRLQARPGAQRLEVWLPGGLAPAAVSRFTVRGGGA